MSENKENVLSASEIFEPLKKLNETSEDCFEKFKEKLRSSKENSISDFLYEFNKLKPKIIFEIRKKYFKELSECDFKMKNEKESFNGKIEKFEIELWELSFKSNNLNKKNEENKSDDEKNKSDDDDDYNKLYKELEKLLETYEDLQKNKNNEDLIDIANEEIEKINTFSNSFPDVLLKNTQDLNSIPDKLSQISSKITKLPRYLFKKIIKENENNSLSSMDLSSMDIAQKALEEVAGNLKNISEFFSVVKQFKDFLISKKYEGDYHNEEIREFIKNILYENLRKYVSKKENINIKNYLNDYQMMLCVLVSHKEIKNPLKNTENSYEDLNKELLKKLDKLTQDDPTLSEQDLKIINEEIDEINCFCEIFELKNMKLTENLIKEKITNITNENKIPFWKKIFGPKKSNNKEESKNNVSKSKQKQ